ncbi:MAG: fasciclin domain-containing protein [Ferruginibacter sp.]
MKKIKYQLLLALTGMVIFSSCNKDLEQLAPITVPAYPTGSGIAATIAANPNDSLFNKLITRAGYAATLNDLTKTFTVFAVDNAGMRKFVAAASGGAVPEASPDAVHSAFISGTLPVASAAGIMQYLTLGQKLPSASIGSGFPNFPYTTQIILDPTQPFVRMPIFPVRGTAFSYVNNMPLTSVDQTAANGVIHHVFTVTAPPSATLKTMLAGESTLTYFRAAVARADSGSTGLSKFDSLLNYGVTNMTVLAPNDNAFKTLVFGLAFQGYLATRPTPYTATDTANATATANGAVAAGPAFLSTNNVTTAQVKGIVAYHLLASLTSSTTTPYQPNIRVFSTNIPATPAFVKTLVNGSLSVHPGISVKATYAGAFAIAATFTGYGTFPPGGAPYSGAPANAVTLDKHAVNGVYHIIDKVLLPQ